MILVRHGPLDLQHPASPPPTAPFSKSYLSRGGTTIPPHHSRPERLLSLLRTAPVKSADIVLRRLHLTDDAVWFDATACNVAMQLNTLVSGITVPMTCVFDCVLLTFRSTFSSSPRLLTILFTPLLGAIILIPTTGLTSMGFVPGYVPWKVVRVVSLHDSRLELIGRHELLSSAIPTFARGQLLRIFVPR